LGNLNLTQFIKEDLSGWDYEKLEKIIPIAVRFMDNVNDLTYVPLQEQKENLKNKRRIGLGILGYGSALLMMKIKYVKKKDEEKEDTLDPEEKGEQKEDVYNSEKEDYHLSEIKE
jgi:ribonucleotide reductase alpha subunit